MAERAAFALHTCTRRHVLCYTRLMPLPDFNLLVTLDVLLSQGSVARAAERLQLSPSAMSRALARLRESTGDPLLIRAGRGLVPTPRAMELRERVGQLVREAEAVLRPAGTLDLATVERTFTLRTSEGFAETFGPDLVARIAQEAPRVLLRFVPKPDKDSTPLRDGSVDLETGVVATTIGPEVIAQSLFRDRLVGVVRAGHALCEGDITPSRFVSHRHVLVQRRGLEMAALDEALSGLGLERSIAAIVGGFATALAMARSSDLIATVPDRHTAGLRAGLFSFRLPVATPEFTISLLWHPRMDADPTHRWVRGCVREVLRSSEHLHEQEADLRRAF